MKMVSPGASDAVTALCGVANGVLDAVPLFESLPYGATQYVVENAGVIQENAPNRTVNSLFMTGVAETS